MLTNAGRWFRKHAQALVLGVLLPLALSSLAYEACKSVSRTRAIVTKICAEAYEIQEGKQVKVWAETFPQNLRPSKYNWTPEDRVINNGQQLVLLSTETDKPHKESYFITVSLTPLDDDGSPLPQPSPITIKVVPEALYNNKPKIIKHISVNPAGRELLAGDSVMLEALATDDDREDQKGLYYDWYVENESARIERNGEPQVILHTPPDLARYTSIPMRVKLTVRDGKQGGTADEETTLMVVPKVKPPTRYGQHPRTRYIIVVKPQPGTQGTNTNAAPVPTPHPEPSPAKPTPPEAVAPKSPSPTPARPQPTKDGEPDGAHLT